MKALIAAILLLAVMETARGAADLATLTCPDRYGPMVFLLNLDTHSVVSAIDKKLLAKVDSCSAACRENQEVAIRTEKHPNTAVVIWVAVADEEVFVRSVRGTKGRWYRDLAAGGPATLEFAGRQLAVQAIAVSDPTAVARASQEYLQKYQPSPYAQAMVRSDVLPTTLRLEPR